MNTSTPASRNRVTISDVARLADVTKGTVSKYLNRRPGYYVADETAARIERAISKLGFEPSDIARGLTHARTNSLAVVVADLRNPYYPDIVAGVQDVAEAAGFTVLLGSTGYELKRESDIVRSMIRRRIDGVVLASLRRGSDAIQRFNEAGVQVAVAARDLPWLEVDIARGDDRGGALMAMEHLLSLGHQRIAHIAGDPDIYPFQQRKAAYAESLATAGIELDPRLTAHATAEPGSAEAAVRQLLAVDAPPTAIFAANDTLALRALSELRLLGVEVPRKMSLIGFDNIGIGAFPGLELTTIDGAPEWAGATAVEMLIKRLNAVELPPVPHTAVHPAKLVLRSTTGPLAS